MDVPFPVREGSGARLPLLLLLHSCMLAAGCGEGRPAEGPPEGVGAPAAVTVAFTVTDSAGVRIVSARVSEATPQWTLAPDPELEIGQAEGEAPHLFQRPEFAARLSDGRVVVADFGSGQLRYFDGADGRFLASAGRRGQGPGEFQEFNRVVLLPGDTVVVYDERNLRVTRIGAEGERAGELSLRDPIMSRFEAQVRVVGRSEARLVGSGAEARFTRWRNLIFAGPLEGGRHAMLFFELVQAPPSVDRDTLRGDVEVAVLGAGGEGAGTVAVIPGPLRFAQWIEQPEPRGAIAVTQPVPFAPQVLLAARGDRIVVSSGDRFELRIHDASGRLRQVIRREDPGADPEPVGRVDVEGHSAWRTTWPGIPGPEVAGEVANLLGESYRLPTHGDLLLDDEGRVWVQDYLAPWDDQDPEVPRTYTVFDPEGEILATATLPGELSVTHIGADHVTGVVWDDMGVERVRVYRILRPDPTSAS